MCYNLKKGYKMKFFVKFLLSCVALTSIAFSQTNQQNPLHEQYLKAKQIAHQQNVKWEDLNEALVVAVQELNKKLPKKVDKTTTLQKAEYDKNKRVLVYNGTISNVSQNFADAMNKNNEAFKKVFVRLLTQNQAAKLCTNPNIIIFLENNGKIVYNYKIKDPKIKKSYDITTKIDSKVCKELGIW